jgi:hypothetical protein
MSSRSRTSPIGTLGHAPDGYDGGEVATADRRDLGALQGPDMTVRRSILLPTTLLHWRVSPWGAKSPLGEWSCEFEVNAVWVRE